MEAAPLIQGGIAIVGALTAYFAAQRGVAVGMTKMQKDIDHIDKEIAHIWDEVGRDRNSGHRGRLHTLGNSSYQHEMRLHLLEQGTPAHGMPKPEHPFEDD